MATAQLIRVQENETKQETISSIIPTSLATKEESVVFVKKLVAVGLSTITYLRVIFPEEAYKDKNADGIGLKLLMDNSGCKGAQTMISWIKGCFDAIEKGYLKQMTLAICEDASEIEMANETYCFKFTYSASGEVELETIEANCKQKGENNKFEVKKPTLKMIRTIIFLAQSLHPVPDCASVSMKLMYYDEVTPADYEPPGFVASDNESFSFRQNPVKFKVGDVNTPFHSFKLRATVVPTIFKTGNLLPKYPNDVYCETTKTSIETMPCPLTKATNFKKNSPFHRHSNSVSNSPQKDNNALVPSLERRLSSLTNLSAHSQNINSPDPLETPCVTPKLEDVYSSSNIGSAKSVRSVQVDIGPTQSEYPIRCPCNVNMDQGIMILCDVCGFWQHGACFTIIEESDAPSKHFCHICADPPSLCTDPRLCVPEMSKVIEQTCLFRRTLVILSHFEGKISASNLSQRLGVDISIGQNIMEKLVSDHLIHAGKSKNSGIIQRKLLLKCAFPKYLNKFPNADMLKGLTDSQEQDVEVISVPHSQSSQKSTKSNSQLDDEPLPQKLTQHSHSYDSDATCISHEGFLQDEQDKENFEKSNNLLSKLTLSKSGKKRNFEHCQMEFDISDSQGSSRAVPANKRKISKPLVAL